MGVRVPSSAFFQNNNKQKIVYVMIEWKHDNLAQCRCGTLLRKTIEYRFLRGEVDARQFENLIFVSMWHSAEKND